MGKSDKIKLKSKQLMEALEANAKKELVAVNGVKRLTLGKKSVAKSSSKKAVNFNK